MSASGDTNIFDLKDISYNYPSGEAALEKITMSVRRGEKVALLGANGSGKSTLLKLMNGLLCVSSGSLTALGMELNEQNLAMEELAYDFHRRTGFVFQNSDAQLFNTNVREEIAFGPVQLGMSKEEVYKAVDEVVGMLHLEHLLQRPPFRLSGGEKKLVALASVLVLDPEVILLDEPTNGLDPRTQRRLIHMIKHQWQAGKTIITATHNLEIVSEIADRVFVFNEEHHLVASGASRDILTDRELLVRVNLIDDDFHVHSHADTMILHAHDDQ